VSPSLAERELIVVTGKGGVGKTTVTAALGHALRARGRRVLLFETDPRESLHRLLGTRPSGGDVVEAADGLWHLSLDPRDEMEAMVRSRIRVPLLAGAVAASPVFRHFMEAAPGLKELATLGHALRLVRGQTGPGVDTVVLDAPATGHGVSMLAAPQLVTDVLGKGPAADLAAEIAAFVGDGARCGVVVVTLAEEMPVQETIELIAALDARIGRPPDLVVVNQVYPPRGPPKKGGREGGHLWTRRRAINEAEMARLRRHWTGPTVELPLLPHDPGPELARGLAARLARS
jgi:anion-transporting  ArsA/GET3 family ATPase